MFALSQFCRVCFQHQRIYTYNITSQLKIATFHLAESVWAIHFPQMRKLANTLINRPPYLISVDTSRSSQYINAYQHLLLSTAVLLLSALSAKWKVAIFYCALCTVQVVVHNEHDKFSCTPPNQYKAWPTLCTTKVYFGTECHCEP